MTAAAMTQETPPPRPRRGTNVRQRSAQVGVRLLPHEMELLQAEAARRRVSPAEILRRAFLTEPRVT